MPPTKIKSLEIENYSSVLDKGILYIAITMMDVGAQRRTPFGALHIG